MPNNITIFREPGTGYLNVIIDGMIVDGLGPDETLATVAAALLEGTYPPYAKRRALQELREQECEAAVRHKLRNEAAGMRQRLLQAMTASGWLEVRDGGLYNPVDARPEDEMFDRLVQYLTTNQGDAP